MASRQLVCQGLDDAAAAALARELATNKELTSLDLRVSGNLALPGASHEQQSFCPNLPIQGYSKLDCGLQICRTIRLERRVPKL